MKSPTTKTALKSPSEKSVKKAQLIVFAIFIAFLFFIFLGKSQSPSYNPPASAYSSDNNYGYNKETVRFLRDSGISPNEARASEEIIRKNCGEECN